MPSVSISISNLHCSGCHDTVISVLSKHWPVVQTAASDSLPAAGVAVHIAGNTVHLLSRKKLQFPGPVLRELEASGLDVAGWDLFDDEEHSIHAGVSHTTVPWWNVARRVLLHRRQYRHLQYCSECQHADHSLEKTISSDSTAGSTSFRAVVSITGMTCASCTTTITDSVTLLLKLNGVASPEVTVSSVTNTAVVFLPNKQMANLVVAAIEHVGYGATLVEVLANDGAQPVTVRATLGGITCAACVLLVDAAVSELPGLLDHSVSVVQRLGVFVVELRDVIEPLKQCIEDAGFDFQVVEVSASPHSRTVDIAVDGMLCSHCPETVVQVLSKYGDVANPQAFLLESPVVEFVYMPSDTTRLRDILQELLDQRPNGNQLTATLAKRPSVEDRLAEMHRRETRRLVFRLALLVVVAIPTFVFGVVAMLLLPRHNSFRMWVEEPLWVGNVSRNTWVLLILATPVYFFAADVFHRKAFAEVRLLWWLQLLWRRRLLQFGSMNLLMCLGTLVAYFCSIALLVLALQTPAKEMGDMTSYFDLVVFLSMFLLVGRLLESYSKGKTASAVESLGKFKSTTAVVVDQTSDGYTNAREIDVNLVEVGDWVRVVNGAAPPVDCILVDATATFDESALTGELRPVVHKAGEQLFAGLINVGDSVVARALALLLQLMLDQIVLLVRDGQMAKAPIERAADRLTSSFVPVVVLLAVITFVVWVALGTLGALPQHYLDVDVGGWVVWLLEFAIAVFVIACPCGIGLAAPTALYVGAGLAAKHGILAKGGGAAFQEGSRVNVIAFDKTGTLTLGKLSVAGYAWTVAAKEREAIREAVLAVEAHSGHPLARCVREWAGSEGSTVVEQSEEIPGKGVSGKVVGGVLAGRTVMVGSHTMMEGYSYSAREKEVISTWQREGKSVVVVALRDETHPRPVLYLATRDQVRPEAASVVRRLAARGIECWMISGDAKATAESVAAELGIEHVIGEVLPADKALAVESLRKGRRVVAMVGDGINDAPALAAADVGIAMAAGSDLAMHAADFVLLGAQHPLVGVLLLVQLSRTVFRRVRFNFGWALVYNMVGLPIAAGVIYPYKNSRLSPVWALAAMALSSVSVVCSSLALKWTRVEQVDIGSEAAVGTSAVEVVM